MTTAIELLRAQYRQSFDWLQGTMTGVTEEVAHYDPPGHALPIAAQVGHVVAGVDGFLLATVAERAPLAATEFAGKTGLSELPPAGPWAEWGERVRVDPAQLHDYAGAVFAAVDDQLATMSDADLDRKADFGLAGEQTLAWAFGIMLLNTYCHTGEIACIKGMQGLQGYPM